MELATLPRVAEPAGFNFAEVRATDTAALESLLGQLGFGFNGRHRSKNVQLWTLGQARIIRETDPLEFEVGLLYVFDDDGKIAELEGYTGHDEVRKAAGLD